MAYRALIAAVGLIASASPVMAGNAEPTEIRAAPAGTEATRYCLRIEAITGTRLEEVRCWTRAEWADRGVDVDAEWAEEGVAVKG